MRRLWIQLREWAKNFLADLLHPFVCLTPVQFIQRGFWPRWLSTELAGHRSVVIEAHDIHPDVGLCQFLPDDWISTQRLALTLHFFGRVDDVIQGPLDLHLRTERGRTTF